MKVLVTGGAGYLGTVLVPLLLERGHEVVVLDTLAHAQTVFQEHASKAAFAFVRGDVRDGEAVSRAVQGCDAIVHLGGIVGFPACHADPGLSWSVNVLGTQTVLACAGRRRVVFASTGSCYGKVEGVCTEATPINPLTFYGRQKAEAERAVRGYAGPWTILRFATAFGASPRPRLDLLVNDFVWQAVKNKWLNIYEPGARRTFVHVRDMARAVELVLEHPQAIGGTFNVGDEALNHTKAQVARAVAAAVEGTGLNLDREGSDPDARDYAVDYAAVRALGFRCEVSLEDGIRELVRASDMISVRDPYRNVAA